MMAEGGEVIMVQRMQWGFMWCDGMNRLCCV